MLSLLIGELPNQKMRQYISNLQLELEYTLGNFRIQ